MNIPNVYREIYRTNMRFSGGNRKKPTLNRSPKQVFEIFLPESYSPRPQGHIFHCEYLLLHRGKSLAILVEVRFPPLLHHEFLVNKYVDNKT